MYPTENDDINDCYDAVQELNSRWMTGEASDEPKEFIELAEKLVRMAKEELNG